MSHFLPFFSVFLSSRNTFVHFVSCICDNHPVAPIFSIPPPKFPTFSPICPHFPAFPPASFVSPMPWHVRVSVALTRPRGRPALNVSVGRRGISCTSAGATPHIPACPSRVDRLRSRQTVSGAAGSCPPKSRGGGGRRLRWVQAGTPTGFLWCRKGDVLRCGAVHNGPLSPHSPPFPPFHCDFPEELFLRKRPETTTAGG